MAKDAPNNPQRVAEPPVSTPRRVTAEIWLRMKAHPIRNLLILTGMAASIVALAVSSRYVTPHVEVRQSTSDMLATSLRSLDAGDLEQARNVAADLRLRTDIPAEDQGIPAFVLGVVMYEDALDEWHERERRAYFLMAARYLDESRRSGFPKGREARGSFLLGKSFHGANRLAESLPHLLEALDHDSHNNTEICRLLADGYLNVHSPDLAKAGEFNQRYLTDAALTRADRDAAHLIQARITFELGQYENCTKQLDQFQPDSPAYAEVLLLRGRILFTAAIALEGDPKQKETVSARLTEAHRLFSQVCDMSTKNNLLMRQAQHLLGLCRRKLGDFVAAEDVFSRNRRSHFDSPEGLASGIEEAELQHLLGNDTQALTAYSRVLRQIADTPGHALPWISDNELRKRLEATVAEYRHEHDYDAAHQLLLAIILVFPDARTVEAQATLHEKWAEYLSKQAVDPKSAPPGKDYVALRTQARLEHRQAGVDFSRLAKLRFATREYPDELWRSAENYLKGQDYDSAVLVYRKHLDSQPRNGRSPALTRLGECLLALNRPDEALKYVGECIEFFPKDPFVYRARIIAAEAGLEMGQDQQAKALLIANLENESLTPQSREWRDSLFALGRYYFLDGSRHETASRRNGIESANPVERLAGMKELESASDAFRESVARLSEAVQRDPDAEQAIEARYMLAMAHSHIAKLPRKQLTGITIETTRVSLHREMQRELNAAITEFENLKSLITSKQEDRDLTPVEARILRNCYFGKADALFDLEQLEEAVEAYSSVTNRYQQHPESLEAFVQIAICQRKLNRLADSRRTLQQAEGVLNRMPTNADFASTTRYDRKEWSDLLGWLGSL